jgi:HEAT repeat protein
METLKKVMCVAVFLGLGVQPEAFSQEVPPDQALELRQAVTAWLECEECTEGQLEAVLRLGELAVPSLGAALERGPSPASLERLQMHLERNYREMSVYAETHDEVKMDFKLEEYVKIYLENYVASHRARAAEALGKIGGESAKARLEAASRLKLRSDVLAVVRESANKAR